MKHIRFWAALLFIGLLFIAGTATAQLTQTYMVTNQTGMTITTVSISQNEANKWSTNLLTKDKVLNSESFEFKQSVDKANCVYDIKFMADNGKEYYMQDVNLCNVSTISLVSPDKDQKMDKTDKK